MKVFYCDHFAQPLPPGHRFPTQKYRLLRERIKAHNDGRFQLLEPQAASDADILLAHDPGYLQRVINGGLSAREQRVLGSPWSRELVERSRRSSGATIAACRAGGTHYALRDQAQGFCVFNDSAIAARATQRDRLARRTLIVDCDVHQGNGTASILRDEPASFTFSIHGAGNFPGRKEPGDLDVALPDGATDQAYLDALERGLRQAVVRARADHMIYIAGADLFEGDRLGRLRVSKQGLAARDELVYDCCQEHGLPVAVVMGGGYAPDVHDIVDIHYESVARALRLACEGSG